MPRVLGAEWVYLAPSRLPPLFFHPLSLPSSPLLPLALCALSPLLPLLSPGHSALVSTHNGRSVLTLLTLHSACALGSGHGRERKRGPGGKVKGWQQLTPCDQNAIKYQPPPPALRLFQRPASNFTHPYRWAVKVEPVGLLARRKTKTSTSPVRQMNRCLLWLTGNSLARFSCLNSYMCVPFFSLLLGTHPKRNFKTWLQIIFVWEIIPLTSSTVRVDLAYLQSEALLLCLPEIRYSS